MTEIGWVHVTFSGVAISAGGVVLLLPKGTRWHRTVGHVYVTSMLGICVSAFFLYTLTGRWGIFHWAAIVALVTLTGGLYTVLRRRPRKHWIEAHATWMSWSYVGLMCAFAAESLTRFVTPVAASYLARNQLWPVFWTLVGVGSFGMGGVGWWLVRTRLPGAVASTPARMRQDRERLARAGAEATVPP